MSTEQPSDQHAPIETLAAPPTTREQAEDVKGGSTVLEERPADGTSTALLGTFEILSSYPTSSSRLRGITDT